MKYTNIFKRVLHSLSPSLYGRGLGGGSVLLILCLTSCNSFFDVDSRHSVGEEGQWTSVEENRAALMGVYALTRSALVADNAWWVSGELPMGDFSVTSAESELRHVCDLDFAAATTTARAIGDRRRYYRAINAAAVFIENAKRTVGEDKAYSEQNCQWDVAQARALRALLYWQLARVYGSAPLITEAYDGVEVPPAAPAPQSELLAYAADQLLQAARDLPTVFGSSSNKYYYQTPDYWQGTLIAQTGCYALLAHIAAMQGRYADCEAYCQTVMSQMSETDKTLPAYTATDVLCSTSGPFSSDSRSYARNRLIGFPAPYSGNEASQQGHIEALTLAAPYVRRQDPDIYLSADTLRAIYNEAHDERLSVDTTTMTYNSAFVDMTTTRPLLRKIRLVQDGNAKDVDYAVFSSALIVTRPEDILLLRAEACWALNRTEEAITLLNAMRSRRGLSDVSLNHTFGGSRTLVLDAIFSERRRELIGEGWRWYDIIRRQRLLRDNPDLLGRIESGNIYWKSGQ